jgi:hypothetical protein
MFNGHFLGVPWVAVVDIVENTDFFHQCKPMFWKSLTIVLHKFISHFCKWLLPTGWSLYQPIVTFSAPWGQWLDVILY